MGLPFETEPRSQKLTTCRTGQRIMGAERVPTGYVDDFER